MNYELALKLKDAGFPFKEDFKGDLFIGGFYEPTLSELIEACGKIDVHIGYQDDGRIYAEFDTYDKHDNLLDFCMPTLEEIYAHLWLALNEK